MIGLKKDIYIPFFAIKARIILRFEHINFCLDRDRIKNLDQKGHCRGFELARLRLQIQRLNHLAMKQQKTLERLALSSKWLFI